MIVRNQLKEAVVLSSVLSATLVKVSNVFAALADLFRDNFAISLPNWGHGIQRHSILYGLNTYFCLNSN